MMVDPDGQQGYPAVQIREMRLEGMQNAGMTRQEAIASLRSQYAREGVATLGMIGGTAAGAAILGKVGTAATVQEVRQPGFFSRTMQSFSNLFSRGAQATPGLQQGVQAAQVYSPTVQELQGIATKGFQAHHILPQYLGKMLGYTTQQMLSHPGTMVTQWKHTGALNPEALHKAINQFLPAMVNGQRVTYTANQIQVGLEKAYNQLGRSDLYRSVKN